MIAFISYVVSNLNTYITDVPAVNAATGSFCAGYMASSWGYYRSQDAREVAKVALNVLDGLRKKDKKNSASCNSASSKRSSRSVEHLQNWSHGRSQQRSFEA